MSTQHGRMGRKKGSVRGSGKGSAGKRAAAALKNDLTAHNLRLKRSKISAARQVANAVSMGFLGIEKKFLDMTKSEGAVQAATALTGGEYDPSTGCTNCLSCPAQGDTEQSRDGKRIVIDSLIFKGYVANPAVDTSADPLSPRKIFVAIVLDTQTNGAQMSSEECFKSLGNAAPLNVCPTKNLLSGNRFRILKSQVYDLTPTGFAGTTATYGYNATRREIDWYIPFKGGLQVNLNAGTTADVANVIDNSIHCIAFATVADTVLAYNARIRFQG